MSSHGWWGVWAYILLFVIASLFLFPGSVLVIAGGVVFGVFYGTIISLFAATLASSLSFLVARYLGRAWLLRRFGGNQKFEQIERGIQRYGVDF
ncbi:TVP38/TMEM64 family protein, partial [Obesumbacterium proteus]|uniref:TVP38/TMEM64 family protein n=1 Tax=Obesumbacterium proteus TaxID=82983 RepID=UPI001F0A2779